MYQKEKGFTLIEIISVLVVLAFSPPWPSRNTMTCRKKPASRPPPPRYPKRRPASTWLCAVLLNHGECKDIAALLMTPLGDGKGDGSLYIGDDDAHFEDKTAGKVGGWIFWVDESKKLETVNEDTRVGLLEDPDGNKIDMSETGLYLRIPQCNSSNKDEK